MRVTVTSLNSIGNISSVLSIVIDTSARPSAFFAEVPAKMTSSIFWDRTAVGAWAPSTQANASTTFDFPLPFGPTTTVMPGSRTRLAGSANDLKPLMVSALRNTTEPFASRERGGDREDGLASDLGVAEEHEVVLEARLLDRHPRTRAQLSGPSVNGQVLSVLAFLA